VGLMNASLYGSFWSLMKVLFSKKIKNKKNKIFLIVHIFTIIFITHKNNISHITKLILHFIHL
jgi:hypothetical protein